MNREEQFDKNLELAREFFVGLLDQPIETWPENGATIVFLPDDDPELVRANLEMVETMRARDPEEVTRLHIVTEVGPTPAPREERATG